MEKKTIGYYIKKEKKIDIRTYKNAYWYLDNLISTSTMAFLLWHWAVEHNIMNFLSCN